MKTIAVVGLGYVGIPVALKIANSGTETIGIDIDKNKINLLNNSIYPIEGEEPGIVELLEKSIKLGKFVATDNYYDAAHVDAWLVCVQTPFLVDEFKPNFNALNGALKSIGENMGKNCLVVIESTIPPGTMQDLVIPRLEKYSGFKVGLDFSVGHCPERVMPGKLLSNLSYYERALGGFDDKSHKLMIEVYSKITSGKLNKVNLKTAEVVKTFENTYRDVEIAIANDFAIYCDNVEVDFYEVRKLVNQVESRNLHLPGGVGGHCIPKDTWLLAYGSRNSYTPNFLLHAREVNDNMPKYISNKALEALSSIGQDIKNPKVSILGLSYLEESDDVRNSPSEDLINNLKTKGVDNIYVHDSFVKEHKSINITHELEEVLHNSDILILMVRHSEYYNLDLEYIAELMNNKIIIDTRNVFDTMSMKSLNFKYYSIGRGSN